MRRGSVSALIGGGAGAQAPCDSADWRRSRRRRRAVRTMAGPGLVAGDVVVDALPYFDQGYEAPGVREAVSAGPGEAAAKGRGGVPASCRVCARLRRW